MSEFMSGLEVIGFKKELIWWCCSWWQSGTTVSLSSDGTIVAIGSPLHDTSKGHVRVYEWTVIYNNGNVSGSWNLKGSDIDGEVAGDGSGKSVSLSSDGTILAIGANFYDGDSGSSLMIEDMLGYINMFQMIGKKSELVLMVKLIVLMLVDKVVVQYH